MTKVYVRRGGTETGAADIVLDAGKNLLTGEDDFVKHYKTITTLEEDLLLIASSVFAADRCIQRGEREDLTRGIELSIPIINIGKIQPFAKKVEDILRTLSNDSWRITFRQQDGMQESKLEVASAKGGTLLFSGGLDSLAAAFEFGSLQNSLQLVSHITKNQPTDRAQKELAKLIQEKGGALLHRQFFISSRDAAPNPGIDHDAENSQRTRSFMFLVVGALAARRIGHNELLMLAENGQMAIHLPLTPGRIGAFSTHTAHPNVLAKVQEFIQGVLTSPMKITNPYVNRTKAEVVKVLWKGLRKAIPISTSCWKNTRLKPGITHCGSCVPCFIRKISIETHGKDETAYARDFFNEKFAQLPPEDDGRRNLADIAEFMLRFEISGEQELMDEWPELYSSNVDAKAEGAPEIWTV